MSRHVPPDHRAPDAFAGLTARRRRRGLPVGRLGPCPDCGGSGCDRKVLNPVWPAGDEPHFELTDDPCPSCGGSGLEGADG